MFTKTAKDKIICEEANLESAMKIIVPEHMCVQYICLYKCMYVVCVRERKRESGIRGSGREDRKMDSTKEYSFIKIISI